MLKLEIKFGQTFKNRFFCCSQPAIVFQLQQAIIFKDIHTYADKAKIIISTNSSKNQYDSEDQIFSYEQYMLITNEKGEDVIKIKNFWVTSNIIKVNVYGAKNQKSDSI